MDSNHLLMKRILLSLLCFHGFVFLINSQTLCCDGDIKHMETNITLGLNTDGYQAEAGIAYFPYQYFGIKFQIGVAGEIEQIDDWGHSGYETGHFYATRFKTILSLPIRSPKIYRWNRFDGSFYLFFEPGISLSPGARGSQKAQWFNWDSKVGVNFQLSEIILHIGYGISNFNLHSGSPYSYWSFHSRDGHLTHSGIIGISYKF